MQLDALPLVHARVGYGSLGFRGALGYEGKGVTVNGRAYTGAISAHAPSRVLYRLGGAFSRFRSHVALNDDVPPGRSHADFAVIADGKEVGLASHVVAGEAPAPVDADIAGAHLLELVVTTGRWEWCHSVWLDPIVDVMSVSAAPRTLTDCLNRAEIVLPPITPRVTRCVATVVTARFVDLLDDMLGSLNANGGCRDTRLVVFALDDDPACARVVAKYGGRLIACRPRAPVNPMTKGLLYSVARVIDADYFVCLDADMIVLDDLRAVFRALQAAPAEAIYACREGNGQGLVNLGHALEAVYGGSRSDFQRLLGSPDSEWSYSLVVNDGIFAGGRSALLALDGVIRAMPEAAKWIDERPDIRWRNQFIFNLALAKLGCGAELDSSYNVQLHAQDVQPRRDGARFCAGWRGRDARILHFSGAGRHKHPEWKGLFSRVSDPLVGAGAGDPYAEFLRALHAWIGRHGLQALAWSFYGTTDASSACVRDPGVMPLFALFHYLLRANGCVRVLEAGTARGVSTACIASAVAHRPDARVITFDPYVLPERADLWDTLPEPMLRCIEARQTGSIEGMGAALAAGERYDAAFLDSVHTAEHVWGEFELAAQLVCPGGLIVIHDAIYLGGTVQEALRRIEAAGYGVVRLWTAECGVPEDDHLGLAVIENRRRPAAKDPP
jgi:predicted O-methyltransferase YrrM